ncbi:MAG: hypothetical protein WCI92_19645, partial [Bacteroidota bacterium]
MKTNFRFFALIVLSILVGNVHAQTATDYSTMYSRIYTTSFGSGLSSYNLSNQNADGTFVNVSTYPATQPTPNTGAPREHLDEMLKIARAYQTSGS